VVPQQQSQEARVEEQVLIRSVQEVQVEERPTVQVQHRRKLQEQVVEPVVIPVLLLLPVNLVRVIFVAVVEPILLPLPVNLVRVIFVAPVPLMGILLLLVELMC